MANPQKENGYTAIADEIMDALIASHLSGQDFKIALLIIRKTYGFNKIEDAVSLTQMMKSTGMSKIRCSQVVNRLELMKILTVTENINGIGKKYKFNKDFETWQTVNENINRYRKTKQTITKKRNRPLMKTLTTKDNIKDNKLIGESKADSRVKIFIDWYFTMYQKRFKRKYAIPSGAKTGQQVKNILKSGLSFTDIQLCAMLFMLDQDPFLAGTEETTGAGYDIGIFLTRMNKYDFQKAKQNPNLMKWLIDEQGEYIFEYEKLLLNRKRDSNSQGVGWQP